jgi:hypothetical protein
MDNPIEITSTIDRLMTAVLHRDRWLQRHQQHQRTNDFQRQLGASDALLAAAAVEAGHVANGQGTVPHATLKGVWLEHHGMERDWYAAVRLEVLPAEVRA